MPNASDHFRTTVVFACVGVFASYLPVVGVSVALPVIQQGLHASTAGLQWITDAFILPTAALPLTLGTLGERFGRKKTYLAGLALAANSSLRQIGSALGPAIFGVILTGRLLSTLAGHLASSGLETASQAPVNGLVHGAGIQAGAFLRLSTPATTAQAVSAYDASFTDALPACALVGGIGMLLSASVALAFIGVRTRSQAAGPVPLTHPVGAHAVSK